MTPYQRSVPKVMGFLPLWPGSKVEFLEHFRRSKGDFVRRNTHIGWLLKGPSIPKISTILPTNWGHPISLFFPLIFNHPESNSWLVIAPLTHLYLARRLETTFAYRRCAKRLTRLTFLPSLHRIRCLVAFSRFAGELLVFPRGCFLSHASLGAFEIIWFSLLCVAFVMKNLDTIPWSNLVKTPHSRLPSTPPCTWSTWTSKYNK